MSRRRISIGIALISLILVFDYLCSPMVAYSADRPIELAQDCPGAGCPAGEAGGGAAPAGAAAGGVTAATIAVPGVILIVVALAKFGGAAVPVIFLAAVIAVAVTHPSPPPADASSAKSDAAP